MHTSGDCTDIKDRFVLRGLAIAIASIPDKLEAVAELIRIHEGRPKSSKPCVANVALAEAVAPCLKSMAFEVMLTNPCTAPHSKLCSSLHRWLENEDA